MTQPDSLNPGRPESQMDLAKRSRKCLTSVHHPPGMPASETPSSAVMAHGEDTRPAHAVVTSEGRWVGIGILVFASALALAAVSAGVVFTTPSQSLCPPPSGNGGQDIPCPPGPLTTNNMFTVLTLVILSAVFLAVGIVVEIMVWFRAHPVD